MPRFTYKNPVLPPEEMASIIEPFPHKLHWFLSNGYSPHYYQLLFHTMRTNGKLSRLRHLIAGRRGGKTLSAAQEILYYSTHPNAFHWDAHGKDSNEPLWIWVLTKDYKVGRPALLTFRKSIADAGLVHGVDYKENKTDKLFEFNNGTLVEFKSADDPESLRGAGLDILWIDEAAFINSEDAWNVVVPSLADKKGQAIFTTTPKGKNWYWDEFFADNEDEQLGVVEYRSIDNPYFEQEEWERFRKIYHPLLFKQEFEASFDALMGVELNGDWLHYYTWRELVQDVGSTNGKANLRLYMGVDPAISLSEKADRFAMAIIGVTEDNINAYLIDTFVGRIPFPEQVDMIQTWFHKYRPTMIGVEAQAYQAALAQQVIRLPGMPNIAQLLNTTKKVERILAMAPLFKVGKIKIRKEHYDFIDEWVSYDSQLRNPKDDCLDAVELALRTAGALLPTPFEVPLEKKTSSWEELMLKESREGDSNSSAPYDEFLGEYF